MTPTFRHFACPEGLVSIVTACCRILLVLLKLNRVPDEPWTDAIAQEQLLTVAVHPRVSGWSSTVTFSTLKSLFSALEWPTHL